MVVGRESDEDSGMRNVRAAVALWIVAVTAGVVESVLAVVRAMQEDAFGGGDWANVGIRIVVYSAALLMIARFAAGRRWARVGLTVLLTVLGLASLVVPAVLEMAAGQTFVQAFSDGGRLGLGFLTVRLAHIGCVVTASVLMYTPSANRWFGGRAEIASAR